MTEGRSVKTISMLSTHGYVDPIPQLGRTDTGGQVVYVIELAKALSRYGVKVDIYTRWFERSKKQIDPVSASPAVRVIRIRAGPWEFLPKEEIYAVLPELEHNMVDFIETASLQYDLFHAHYVDAGIVALDVADTLGKPVFFTAHSLGAWKRAQMGGDPEEMERRFKFRHRIDEELRIFRSVRAQTVTTETQREKVAELYHFKGKNIEVISPGVDVHTFRPTGARGPLPKPNLPQRYIFCLSRIDSNKGHDLLLKAYARVRREIPDIHLVIGGGSPEPQPREAEVFHRMEEIIGELGIAESVHIVGYVEDEVLPLYYREAELFALPSLFEPFGMTALEAMACATPVVASKFGGIRNVIESGRNGLLVDSENDTEFAEAMVGLLSDPDRADKIGRAGCGTIREEYSWEAIAQKHLSFYEKFMPA